VDVKPSLLLSPVTETHDRTDVEEPFLAVYEQLVKGVPSPVSSPVRPESGAIVWATSTAGASWVAVGYSGAGDSGNSQTLVIDVP
jgi:hypothetical protein